MSANPNRKQRSDSRLKNLPEERQDEIIAYMSAPGVTMDATVKWLAEDGVKTSKASLSEFRSWWVLQQQFREASDDTQTMVELLKETRPDLSAEALEDYGDRVFALKSLKAQDAETYIELKKVRNKAKTDAATLKLKEREGERKEEELELAKKAQALAEEKFERETCELFLKWHKDERAKEIAASNVSNEEKIKQLRLTFFADVDALEQSGAVKLPPPNK